MKVSTKGRYGLRLMFDLAVHYEEGLLPLKEIARREEISSKYLEQIVMQLSRAGLVRSVRGSQGGYSLGREPENITVGTVLRVLEGSLDPVDCVSDDTSPCSRADNCVTMEVWRSIKDAVDEVVDSITLADLVKRHQQKSDCGCGFQCGFSNASKKGKTG